MAARPSLPVAALVGLALDPPSTDPISGPTFLKVRLQPKGDKGRRGIWVAFLGDDFVRPKFHTGGA